VNRETLDPDIEFGATVRAETLRFGRPPTTGVVLSGTPGRRSMTTSRRVHLDDPVAEGVDYRDVYVEYGFANELDMGD
jgi:hypothetical protein